MFRRFSLNLALFALMAMAAPLAVLADSTGQPQAITPVTIQSSQSFDKTVSSLKKLVAKNGMMVMGEVNQGKIMSMAGVNIKAVSFLIGSPVVGKKLFAENVGSAVAAPFRVTVYTDRAGKTHISYYQPSVLLGSFPSEKIGMVAQKIDEQLAMLAAQAGK